MVKTFRAVVKRLPPPLYTKTHSLLSRSRPLCFFCMKCSPWYDMGFPNLAKSYVLLSGSVSLRTSWHYILLLLLLTAVAVGIIYRRTTTQQPSKSTSAAAEPSSTQQRLSRPAANQQSGRHFQLFHERMLYILLLIFILILVLYIYIFVQLLASCVVEYINIIPYYNLTTQHVSFTFIYTYIYINVLLFLEHNYIYINNISR